MSRPAPRRFARIIITVAAMLAATAFAGAARAKEWTHLTIGVEGAFPPFNMMGPDGKPTGFDVDIANEVCKRAKLTCDLVAQDWDSQIPSLTVGKFDAILTVGPNAQRRKVIDFTVPYAQTANTFAVAKPGPLASLPDTGQHMSVDDPAFRAVLEALRTALKGKVIGVPISTSQQQFIEDNFQGDVQVRTYKSSKENDLDLLAGRIDAEFNNNVYLTGAVSDNADMAMAGPLLVGGVMATDVCLGIRKNEPELKAMLDQAIQSAAADGTIRALSVRWFKTDVSPRR